MKYAKWLLCRMVSVGATFLPSLLPFRVFSVCLGSFVDLHFISPLGAVQGDGWHNIGLQGVSVRCVWVLGGHTVFTACHQGLSPLSLPLVPSIHLIPINIFLGLGLSSSTLFNIRLPLHWVEYLEENLFGSSALHLDSLAPRSVQSEPQAVATVTLSHH